MNDIPQDNTIQRVLDFWFGPNRAEVLEFQEHWFKSTPEFDAQIADGFAEDYERASAGSLDDLAETPEGALALIILLDQFPRNLFRGTAKAFEADEKARAVARRALDAGHDERLRPQARMFLYLPFEHSEDLADQDLAVVLFEKLENADWLDYAIRHRDIVKRFGRFPHRNEALGRASTPEETEFLKEPSSSF
jgi:uncharacterized protein (DUF924 family)